MIRVYSSPDCPNCTMLKAFLCMHKIEYESINVLSPEGRALMLSEEIFEMQLPILQVDNGVHTASRLFKGEGRMNRDYLVILFGLKR